MISYNEVIAEFITKKAFTNYIYTENLKEASLNIILSLLNNKTIFFGEEEKASTLENKISFKENFNLLEKITESKSKLIFKTSGTTGVPKKVEKSIDEILRGIVIKKEQFNKIWGFCYSTRHISGLYVILQALLTKSSLVDIRNLDKKSLFTTLNSYAVTNISAPTTFFNLNLPLLEKVDSVKNISIGGEPLSKYVYNNILQSFPNAKLKNIYASTEFGSILTSDSYLFKIPFRLKEKIKIKNKIIYVHKSLLSTFKGSENEWFKTNDKINWVNNDEFEIIGRSSEEVKVLGHLVSIQKVEKILNNHPKVKLIKVFAKNHAVFGAILYCDIIPINSNDFNLKEFSNYVKTNLRDYEQPHKINIVKNIEITYSGKIKRNA